MNKPKIINLPKFLDARGNLSFVEQENHIPFAIHRTYWLYDVPGGESRGGHAHRRLQQFVIALSGSFHVTLDDGHERKTVLLNHPWQGLLIDVNTWRTLDDFSSGAVCLVLASEHYDEENKKYVTSEAVLKAEKEILHSIANEESCVIAGRSAFFVMNDNHNRLNILIQASMEHRLERVMAKQGLSEKEAKKVIKEVDETREEYMKNNAHTSRYDTRNYDLVIKMDGKTEEEVANVILAFIG
jgi:cytidylate kinase